MIDQPGIYTDLAPADYYADPCPVPSLTQSIAKILIDDSPAHAKLEHPRLRGKAPEWKAEPYVIAQAIGNAAHATLIGRGRDVVEGGFDDWKTGAAKQVRDLALRDGRIPILSKHKRRAEAMVEAASYQLEALGHGKAFRTGNGEVCLIWREGETWFRTLVDWLQSTTRIYDYKTTALSVAPHAVVDRPSVEGWDVQCAMHERGLNVLDPEHAGRRQFFYVNQENDEPYALTVLEISRADLDNGHSKLEVAVEKWRECMASGKWPRFENVGTLMSRPRGWIETQWTERQLEHRERVRYADKPANTDLIMGG